MVDVPQQPAPAPAGADAWFYHMIWPLVDAMLEDAGLEGARGVATGLSLTRRAAVPRLPSHGASPPLTPRHAELVHMNS